MKSFYVLYVRFMIWLGAAPPEEYEYLLSNTVNKTDEVFSSLITRTYTPAAVIKLLLLSMIAGALFCGMVIPLFSGFIWVGKDGVLFTVFCAISGVVVAPSLVAVLLVDNEVKSTRVKVIVKVAIGATAGAILGSLIGVF